MFSLLLYPHCLSQCFIIKSKHSLNLNDKSILSASDYIRSQVISVVPYFSLCSACIVFHTELKVNDLEVMLLGCISLNHMIG